MRTTQGGEEQDFEWDAWREAGARLREKDNVHHSQGSDEPSDEERRDREQDQGWESDLETPAYIRRNIPLADLALILRGEKVNHYNLND